MLSNPEGKWQLHHTSIKPWPSCRHTHPVIDAALEISTQLKGETPKSIELGVTQAALDVCDKPTPESLYEAKFSLQHCVSTALLEGKVGFDSFDPEKCERTSAMSSKIMLKLNEEFEGAYPEAWGAEVKVVLKNGKELCVRRKHAKGDPDAPLSPAEMRKKAAMLFSYGGVTDAETWVERILKLPQESSFRESDLHRLLDVSGNGKWAVTKG